MRKDQGKGGEREYRRPHWIDHIPCGTERLLVECVLVNERRELACHKKEERPGSCG